MTNWKKTMMASGGFSDTYWLNLLSTNDEEEYRWVTVDGDDNVICVGLCELGAGTYDVLLTKYDTDGTLLWTKSLGSSNYDIGFSVETDSNNNIIVGGRSDYAASNLRDGYVAKFNSSGSLLWNRAIGGGSNDWFDGITVDSNDNIIAVGNQQSATSSANSAFLIVKYNSSGTLQWQNSIHSGANDHFLFDVATDSNDNIFVTGYMNAGIDTYVAKFNSSGTSQWQKTFTGNSVDIGRAITIDGSGDVIVVGDSRSFGVYGSYDFHIIKMANSTGNVTWQRFAGTSSTDRATGVATDVSGNIYVVGTSLNNTFILKYDSSGTLLWQNSLSGANPTLVYAVTTNSLGTPIFAGWTTNGSLLKNNAFVVKVPQDGLGHGTYGGFTYATSSFSTQASGISTSTQTLSPYNAGLTTTTPSRTLSSQTLTQNFYQII